MYIWNTVPISCYHRMSRVFFLRLFFFILIFAIENNEVYCNFFLRWLTFISCYFVVCVLAIFEGGGGLGYNRKRKGSIFNLIENNISWAICEVTHFYGSFQVLSDLKQQNCAHILNLEPLGSKVLYTVTCYNLTKVLREAIGAKSLFIGTIRVKRPLEYAFLGE